MRKSVLIFGHSDATQFIDIYNQYTQLFDKNKYKITLVYLTSEDSHSALQRSNAENVIFLNMAKRQIRGLKIRAIRKMLELSRQEAFEIVICHRYKPIYIMMWVAQFVKIPALFFVMHELNTMTAIGRRLLLACLKKPSMFFAGVSNAVRDNLRKSLWFMPKEQVITLYNALDTEATEAALLSKEEARLQLNINNEAFVFANIGRLVPNKDHTTLLKAFSKIKPQCPNAKLFLAGDGVLEAELKQQAKELSLSHDVIFAGFVKNAFRYMQGFNCFVLSSKQEAFGMVLLEAMMARLPIIATRANGIPEVMGDQGRLIDSKNLDQLANAMLDIYRLEENKRVDMGERAYHYILDHYSIPSFKNSFWQLPVLKELI